MTAASYGGIRGPFERVLVVGWPVALIAVCILLASCGGSRSVSIPAPAFSGNTLVTVVLSSTANDQLSEFTIGFTGISLTNQAGQTVNLLAESDTNQQFAEFVHLNGLAEPLVTSSIPQGVYTAATVAVGDSSFNCITFASSVLGLSTFQYGATLTNAPATTVTVNLASPITITGTSMGLLLDLQVAQSAAYSSCYDPSGNYTYSITPTFNLTPIAFSSQPTSAQNGKVTALDGEVTALNAPGSMLTLSLPAVPTATARTFSVAANGDTVYQGVSNFSDLAQGMFVDIDGAIQGDGSLLATRIAVEDRSAVDVLVGSVLQTAPDEPALPEPAALFFNRFSQGPDPIASTWYYAISSAVFQVSGQIDNLQSLPFTADFDGSNIVPGQNVYVSSQTVATSGGVYTPASTITLMPQTINGTIAASSQGGNFTVYTVTLASYDLFPLLAVQPVQLASLNDPGEVEVYVDSSAQLLNTQPLAVGSTLRFYGLIFNDNGTLRMDCSQVSDGVPENPPTNSSMQARMVHGRVTGVRVSRVGEMVQTTRTIAPLNR